MEKEEIAANSNRQQEQVPVDTSEQVRKPSEAEKRYQEAEASHHTPPKNQEDNYDPNYANNHGQSV
ncbi:hypothetical protein AKO1_007686 [Acrasis kona]|uniref:Uncharacterized protein n=1 Tax=Acrasis kona TaxID=1008807 RepID=A0AAW2YQL5_9EUKA